jgi:hypothetical protein
MRGPFLFSLLLSGLAAAAPVRVPFQTHRGMILVETTVMGSSRPMRFIVDSGAGQTVLAKGTAGELGLALTPGERIRTVDGSENVSRAAATAIRLGSASRSFSFSPRPLVIDLGSESRSLGTKIDGLLGADFFEGRSIRIDFRQSLLHISPAGQPGPRATRLRLSRNRDGMFVELKAADSLLRRVRLDTGCCRALCWSPPGNSSHRVLWRDGGVKHVDVNFGSLVLADIPSDVYRRPLFAGEDGLLGTGLLSRFDSVWIDASNNRIAFDTLRR